MQLIGTRTSIVKDSDVFSVVIMPTDKKWKTDLLFLWLFAWTVCGVIVLANYFMLSNEKSKIVLIIYLGFWAYFEYKIGKAFWFRRFGKEKLWLKGSSLFYRREINKRGKIHEYMDLLNEIKVLEPNRGNFFVQMQESFWVIGGERLSFNYGGKEVLWGIQLIDEDAQTLCREVKAAVKRWEKLNAKNSKS